MISTTALNDFTDFEATDKFKKGEYAESLVSNYLKGKGYVVYKAVTSGPHLIDFVVEKDYQFRFYAEVKAKAKMTHYNYTGINTRHYERYIKLAAESGKKIVLFFVDENEAKIYGNHIMAMSAIDKFHGLKVFDVSEMVEFTTITDEDVSYLKSLSSRKYRYPNGKIF